jgi:hypothetical protein
LRLQVGNQTFVALTFLAAGREAIRGLGPAGLQIRDLATDQFQPLALFGQGEADFAQGIAAQVGFGAADFDVLLAVGDRLAKGRYLRVLGGQGFLGAIATHQGLGLRRLDFVQLALLAVDPVIGRHQGRTSRALIRLRHGKFLRGKLGGGA